tara:strand:- start:394 stop:795 length:402 start_codon:yes stop_codon:yes gene_type:complete
MTNYDDRLRPPAGEPPEEPIRSIANDTGGEWVDRYSWSPGNHTRYDLIYGSRVTEADDHGFDDRQFFLIYVQTGQAMVFSDTHIHYSYIEKKLKVNEADAVGILLFLSKMGHSVGFPKPVGMGMQEEMHRWLR